MAGQGDYVALVKRYENTDFLGKTSAYFPEMRESQKRVLDILKNSFPDGQFSFLDVGCGNGALLWHVAQSFDQAKLYGTDYSQTFVDACRSDARLSGIEFYAADIVAGSSDARLYDVINFHAVLYGFNRDQLKSALTNAAKQLKSGGVIIAYEWMQDDFHDLAVQVTVDPGSDRLTYNVHNTGYMREILEELGFDVVAFDPFQIGVDLKPESRTSTRTVSTVDGNRLMFWGCINQPWTFMTARKKA